MSKIKILPTLMLSSVLLLALSTSGCRSARSKRTTPTEATRTEPTAEEFSTFYNQFLTDSTFQMQRIRFPLTGVKMTAETEDSTYQWTKGQWVMLQKPQLDPTQFTRNLMVTDTLAVDEIKSANTGFYFKMTYRPIDRKWYLVDLVDSSL